MKLEDAMEALKKGHVIVHEGEDIKGVRVNIIIHPESLDDDRWYVLADPSDDTLISY